MAVIGTPIPGSDGRVQYNGGNLNLDSWKVTPQGGDIPTTHFESGGYEEGIVGNGVCDIEFSGFYDRANPPFSVVGLTVGVKSPLKLFTTKAGNGFFSFPSWRLLSAPVEHNVDNKTAHISFKGKSDGVWFYPTA